VKRCEKNAIAGDGDLTEEVVGLGEYGGTLTVLSAESLLEPPGGNEEAEEDEYENLNLARASVGRREAMAGDAPMPRSKHLRRVLILWRNFAANLAYYRIGRQPEYLHLHLQN
jgi:hypothetical protein